MGTSNRAAAGLAAFFLAAGAGFCSAADSKEGLENASFPAGLSKITAPRELQEPGKAVVSYIFHEGEGADTWKEMAGFAIVPRGTPVNEVLARSPAGASMARCTAGEKKSMNIIKIDERRTRYEFTVRDCPGAPDFFQSGIFVEGVASLWHVFYAARTADVAPERAAEARDRQLAIRYKP